MTGTGNVSGKIVSGDKKPPARQFFVDIEPEGGSVPGSWGGSMHCKPDGSFQFKNVPIGKYVVTAKPNPMREGEASPAKPITVTAGKTIDLKIVSN